MNTLTLAGWVAGLALAVGLAATNPTMDGYVRFVEMRLAAEIDKMDQSAPRADRDLIRKIFRAQGSRLVEGLVRPKTTRSNWGLLSLFETNVLEESVLVLGVGGQFIPLRGVEEATLKVGRLAF
jgi:predicted Abi (CAAX) family protease